MSFYARYPFSGGSGGVPTYATLAAFPSAVGAGNGALAIALNSDILYISNGTAWEVLADPTISPFAITALTGDGTATGPGSAALTLATVNSNVGSFGIASSVSTVTVNAKGLVTAASNTAIQITESQVTNLTTDLAGKVPTTRTINTTSPLTGGGALSGDLTLAVTSGNLTDIGTDGITVTGGTGAVLGSGTTISQQVADTTHNGYLSSTDWNTFNNKQASGSYITALTGDVTASGPGSVAATLAAVGTAGTYVKVTTDSKGRVTSGSTAPQAIADGGTGQTTANAAFNALSPMTTAGDIIYGGASGTGTRLAAGTATQILHGGTTPSWSAVSLTADVSGVLPLANGGTGTNAASANAAFNALSPLTTKGDIIGFSTVNARLGVGTNGQILTADSTQTLGVKWADNAAAANVTQGAAGLVASAGQLLGTNTNDNASSGNVGQYLESIQTTQTTLTTATYTDGASLALTAGDWDVDFHVQLFPGNANITVAVFGIGSTSASAPNVGLGVMGINIGTNVLGTYNNGGHTRNRISLSGSATYYGIVRSDFTSGPVEYTCLMSARRVR